VQSNPKAQELMLSKPDNVLNLILHPIREAAENPLTGEGGGDPKLLSKALYALGTLLRGSSLAQQVRQT